MRLLLKSASRLITLTIALLIVIAAGCTQDDDPLLVSIVTDIEPGAVVEYGLGKITSSLEGKGVPYQIIGSLDEATGDRLIVAGLSSGGGAASALLSGSEDPVPEKPEAFCIVRTLIAGKKAWIAGGHDERGLLYALLDIADKITLGGSGKELLDALTETREEPYVITRAISLYTMNKAYWESRLYDESYWTRYMDMLAGNRFNSMVVIFGYENGGFLAPCYPYFFNVEGYPDVGMKGMTPGRQERNLNAINRMMELAHERGIEFKIGLWDHIYRGGIQSGGISDEDQAKQQDDYLVHGVTTENLYDYTKAAISKLLKEMPGLDGIQFRMHNESGLKPGREMEEFWTEVFSTIKEVAPDFKIDLRAKELPDEIIAIAAGMELNFSITTKYWMEQMGLPFHPTHINRQNQHDRRHGYADMLRYPKTYDMHWRMWTGGTQRVLLWGNPDYVRRFAESTHLYDGKGFEVNEPLATKMLAQPHNATPFRLLNSPYEYYDYEFERYWHYFQVFGRVSYNPEVSEDIWKNEFKKRFGDKAGPMLMEALHESGYILPMINAACAPYSLFPTTRGWAAKQILGNLDQYAEAEGSDIQLFASFDEEARLLVYGERTAKRLPSQTSRWFLETSGEIAGLVNESMKYISDVDNKEYISTVIDLRILAALAEYHAHRIPAAVCYRVFTHTNDPQALDDAIRYEAEAIDAWEKIVQAAGDVYAPDLMMGVRKTVKYGIDHCISGHWKDELKVLEDGLEQLKELRSTLPFTAGQRTSPAYKPAEDICYSDVFTIEHEPIGKAALNEDLVIKARIKNPEGVERVRLRFRAVNQHLDYDTLEMMAIPGSEEYSARIPSGSINPSYDLMYFFEIMDRKGKGFMYPDFELQAPYLFVEFER